MDNPSPQRYLAYAIIAVGLCLAFLSAVVPHFTAGYTLMGGVLLAGLLPYLTYGLVVPLLRTALTAVAGIVLLGLHTALVVNERFVDGADYSDGMIYYGPLVLALAMLPLLAVGLRQPWGATPPPGQSDDTA